MKIVALASMPFDLELACFGTLARYIKAGHVVHIIIAKASKDKMGWTQIMMETLRKLSQMIGISQVCFTDRFDYSSVTQDNANVISAFIKTINPSLIIMPFWKASNQKRKILAKTSLIACRGIGSILMYELDRNASFFPTVYFMVSTDEISLKASCLAQHGRMVTNLGLDRKANCFNLDLVTMKKYQISLLSQILRSKSNSEIKSPKNVEDEQDHKKEEHGEKKQSSHPVYSQEGGRNVLVEVFESHRMLLVDNDDGL
jgi:hypothetical protein